MSSSVQFAAQFPEKVAPIFHPKRYKSLRGGRGSAKSHTVAAALVIRGIKEPLRVLCTREVQQSIRDSVHKLLSDKIESLGLSSLYSIDLRGIRGKCGSEFMFAGLSDQTSESLKSYEGVDIVWVEEAQVVSRRSWTVLIPTIRKEASEIWATWNPELDTDPTWELLVQNAGDDVLDIELNWRDNPWFPEVLEQERLKAQRTMSKADYENIWEGKPRPAISGAIYADEVAKLFAEGRAGDYGHDPHLLAYPVFDLGWNDKMSILICQRIASSLRVIDHLEDDHKTLDWYSRELRKREYNWSTVFLPHDGDHEDYKTGKSAKALLEDLGWTVEVLPNLPVSDGIRAARMAFEGLYVNRPRCGRFLEALKRYRRGIPSTTGEPTNPVHDEWSHAADAFRYAALAAPLMTNSVAMKLPALKYGAAGVC